MSPRQPRDAEHTEADRPLYDEASVSELIERSSLGTPAAKALRDSISDEDVRKVLARVKDLQSTSPAQSWLEFSALLGDLINDEDEP